MSANVISFRVLGVGLVGPGLTSWADAQTVLRGEAPYASAAAVIPAPTCLPPAERRRAGLATKVALSAADAACRDAGVAAASLPSVFTSSSGDGVNCHTLCESLASPDRMLSPTRFTNSVHNAPAGYWHIAVGSHSASTSLCAYDDSFDVGLMAALTQLACTGQPVLLVASDAPYPEPLKAKRPIPDAMGVALVLAPVDAEAGIDAGAEGGPGTTASGVIRASLAPIPAGDRTTTSCADEGLEAVRRTLPTGRALPLLEALARGAATTIVLPGQGGVRLTLKVQTPPEGAA